MGKVFCVEFQREPLKFHTKYTHTLKDDIFYTMFKYLEPLDLRAHVRFWNDPQIQQHSTQIYGTTQCSHNMTQEGHYKRRKLNFHLNVPTPRPHFTIYKLIIVLNFFLIFNIMFQSGYNFTHAMIAQLSWHVQNCDLIWLFFLPKSNMLFYEFWVISSWTLCEMVPWCQGLRWPCMNAMKAMNIQYASNTEINIQAKIRWGWHPSENNCWVYHLPHWH